jgi:glycosyltransferase involved in cell wall biosynthesis
VDVDGFRPDENMKSQEKFVITSGASRITARKGLKYLVEAIAKLSAPYPQLRLEILGKGDEEKNLKNLVSELKLEDRVKFLGRIPREETYKYYQRVNLFVLPSANEGISNAMLEALASGLPVIVTDVGGTKELIEDGKNGYIVPLRDAEAIAAAIQKMIDNPEARALMSRENRQKAESMSWKNVAEKYREIYEKISFVF